MLINLLPDFLAVLDADDRESAYRHYRESHRLILDAYWHNYVLDPDSPHADDVVAATLKADRHDLRHLANTVDVVQLAEEAIAKAEEVLQIDRPTDTYLMVGLGGANAGELVVAGRGVAFICLEHFTGRINPATYGMGLPPDLIPPWIAHELAHTVRYTSATSESEMRRLVADLGGYYDYWSTGSRATLRELLVNEGIAVHAAQAIAPDSTPPITSATPAASTTASVKWRRFLSGGRARSREQRTRSPAALSVRGDESGGTAGQRSCDSGARGVLPRASHGRGPGGGAWSGRCRPRAGAGFSGGGGCGEGSADGVGRLSAIGYRLIGGAGSA